MIPPGGPRARIVSLFATVLSVTAALGVAVLAILVIVIPKLWGGVPLTVLTDSMIPGMPPGTLVVSFPVDPADVRIGDVVTYQIASGEPDLITHRVIGAASADDAGPRFILQGDNNASPDPDPIRAAQIRGRVAYSLPYLGWVNSAVGGEHRWLIVGIGSGALFAYAAWNIIGGVRSSREPRSSP